MKRQKLTMRKIADLSADGGKRLYFYDSEVRGLAVQVTPSGEKAFYFIGRLRGSARRVKLANYPEMTISQARECCREMVVESTKGKDVTANRKAGKRTLGDLWNLYLEVHAKPKKRTWKRDVEEWEAYLANWKNKPLVEIRRGVVADRIAEIVQAHSRGTAHKVRALLSKMFTIAVRHEWVEYNPVTGTDRPSYEPRDRYLRPDEVDAFFNAVEQLQRETTRDFLKLAVFTGARRSNLCQMQWAELDLTRGTWTIPKEKFKGKREMVIPLIPPALEILRRRFNERRQGVPWVFPGGGKLGHIVEPKEAMKRVREIAEINDLRFHDLRRSLGAWLNNTGAATRVIQQGLGHADIGTTAKQYAPTEDATVRLAMELAVEKMLENVNTNGKAGE